MIGSVGYKYYFRPRYKSKELLIEIYSGVENDSFEMDISFALAEIQPKVIESEDMWMNDEVLYVYNSNVGSYTISKDIWNIAFITSEENQNGILAIERLLAKDPKFEKMEVDFEKYL